MSFQDKTLTCVSCGAPFVFTAGEQEFYAERQFAHEPKRCSACRQQRAGTRGGGGGGDRAWSGNGGGGAGRAPEAVDPMAVAVPTAITAVPTAAGPAVADRTAVVAGVAVRARCTLPLAAPVETRPVCHSCHAETVRCIAVIASAVSVTADPPGNHTTLCFRSVIVSAGLVRRSRTLSPETAVRPGDTLVSVQAPRVGCGRNFQNRAREGGDVGMFVSLRDGESQEGLLKRFQRSIQNSGLLREVKAKRFFVSPGEKGRIAPASLRPVSSQGAEGGWPRSRYRPSQEVARQATAGVVVCPSTG